MTESGQFLGNFDMTLCLSKWIDDMSKKVDHSLIMVYATWSMPGVVGYTCNSSTLKVEVGESGIQGMH